MSTDHWSTFLGALVDEFVAPDEAAAIDALLSDAQRAIWQRALPIWRQRPPADVNAWLVAKLWPDPELKRLCQDLALTLLFGLPFENGAAVLAGDEGQRAGRHFRGRFWRLVGGHPPGLSGGYYGHWTYPVER